jgi:hypothetical protein
LKRRWSELASSPKARLFTILPVAAQIGAFALDWLDELPLLPQILCPLDWHVYEAGFGVETVCLATGLIFLASPIAGLFAIRFAALRPVYWALLLLVPIGTGGQLLLMHTLGLDHLRIHHG